jgi:hypothetical protein
MMVANGFPRRLCRQQLNIGPTHVLHKQLQSEEFRAPFLPAFIHDEHDDTRHTRGFGRRFESPSAGMARDPVSSVV